MNFIRLVWQQMLTAVNAIHNKHIIHSDLKPGNFLFVKGQLKLIDFGIAKSMPPEATSVLRDSLMGTLSYISPEVLLETGNAGDHGVRIRRSADVWSLGCILYQMVYKRSPWHGLSQHQRLLAIVQSSFQIPFPSLSNPWLLDVMKACLQRDPAKRPAIEGPNGLLEHPFLQPQGQRALQLYKQMSMDNAIMREVIRQIHEVARDQRWEKEGIVPLVTKELVIQRARNRPIDVKAALTNAERKLAV
ncbi:uncharacterized protein [Blastocystis hominis]|uniref:Protein kinase domain-containing protein n=1 Tax=Blastocystis hominis TaxID=12968 RepID=D8M046_BLAHO|nr:uncharacterized protein [Blastocystis hominis]CBK21435.2 unnamed protein product [Blastocystis hominis]|eukprot:XP_012895483.1 uncharacterized protein [Blastocystis hominis]